MYLHWWPEICILKGALHTTPEKFENDVFALKTHQMFSFHTTPEKFENATSRVVIVTSSFIFDKFCFQNVFPSYQNVKPAFSNSSVLCWIGLDGRPNRRHKIAFVKCLRNEK